MRRLDEIKEVFVPNVHLDDAPATDKSLGEGGKLCHPLFRDELRQSNQIVGGGSEGEGPPDATATAELRLLLPGHRLDPAERLFDALADALTDGIAVLSDCFVGERTGLMIVPLARWQATLHSRGM
jgi:hypothetical protein